MGRMPFLSPKLQCQSIELNISQRRKMISKLVRPLIKHLLNKRSQRCLWWVRSHKLMCLQFPNKCPAVCCHYFLPGAWLPCRRKWRDKETWLSNWAYRITAWIWKSPSRHLEASRTIMGLQPDHVNVIDYQSSSAMTCCSHVFRDRPGGCFHPAARWLPFVTLLTCFNTVWAGVSSGRQTMWPKTARLRSAMASGSSTSFVCSHNSNGCKMNYVKQGKHGDQFIIQKWADLHPVENKEERSSNPLWHCYLRC